jgi:hypothetical protein
VWRHNDALGYCARFALAQESHSDWLEEEIFKRIQDPEKNRGSDLLLMFATKAARPQKYREVFTPEPDNAAADLLRTFRKAVREGTDVDVEAFRIRARGRPRNLREGPEDGPEAESGAP